MKIAVSSSWWSSIFNGILAILYGILALSMSETTLILIVKYFGVALVLIGIIITLVAYNRYRKNIPYIWLIFESILFVAIGLVVFFFTRATINLVLITIGLCVSMHSIGELFILANLPKFSGKMLFLVFAVLFLMSGIFMIIYSFRFATTMVFISGIFALVFGVMNIWFAFILRKLQKQSDKTDEVVEIK
ncbi:MAG: DUF308 domain-containing protein [Lentimicrobiaceae bacterium]|jgi:uncharacterized membrane protein HdeD (DUF308 family)|nr:DUF308 domain-containing protein [Lentimicrobiaceae bacterium]